MQPKVRRGFTQELDNRSIIDAFQVYAAPAHVRPKIQIIRPFAVLSRKTVSAAVTLPLGPAYLASVLERAGYQPEIIDAVGSAIFNIRPSKCGHYNIQGLSTEDLLEEIDPSVTIVGISMMFSQEWVLHRDFIKQVKERFPHLKLVVGGEHPTSLPEYILRDCPEIDFIVTGEGELTFLELCHAITHNKNTSEVSGIAFLDVNKKYVQTGLSKRIAQINQIPRPAWHLCKVSNYFINHWTMGISMGRNMPILATRGCPYQCTFCSNPLMWTTHYKMREPADVVDEIKGLIAIHGANSIEFFDLTAIIKKDWILQFCDELKKQNVNINWQLPSGTRSEALDSQTLKAIKETGCTLLVYAPESGSQESLNMIKKKVKIPTITQSIRTAVKFNHTVKINLVIGFPHETIRHVLSTIKFAAKMAWMGVNDVSMTVFTPYPGSELFNQLVKKGVIPVVNDEYFRSLTLMFDLTQESSYCKFVSGKRLSFLRILGHCVFYSISYLAYPRRLVRLVRALSMKNFQPNSVLEQRLYDLLARKQLTSAHVS